MKIHLFLLFVLISFYGISQVRVVTNINNSGPGSLRQQCYNALDGDTITFSPSLLASGSDTLHLTSNIILNKGLVFHGINTAMDTLYISGSNQTQIFYFDLATAGNRDVVLKNMTFIDGHVQGTIESWGTIQARQLKKLEVVQCEFRNCLVENGGGGGLFVFDIDTAIVMNSRFMRNQTTGAIGSGGALSINGKYVEVVNSVFKKNSAQNIGGALSISNCEFLIEGSSFMENDAIDTLFFALGGGALAILSDDQGMIANCEFRDNFTNKDGGAINVSGRFSDTNVIYIESSTFSNNQASPSSTGGGGALSAFRVHVDLKNCSFLNNRSDVDGGAIYQDYLGSFSLRNVSFVGNTANVGGSAIYVPWNRDMHLENVTIHSPLSQSVSVFEVASNSTASVTLENSIIYGSNPNFGSSPTSLGHNIFSNSPSFALATDQVNIDSTQLNLEPLADNGGFAPTRVPGPGSVALNMGTPTDFSPAQNGPIYGRRDVGAAEARTIINDTLLACSPINWWGNTYSTAGTYTDTVFNANSIDSVGILVLERQDTAIINQNAVLLALEDDTNTIYQWVDCDNGYAPIVGETSSSFTPTNNGSYAVILTNGTCSDTSACIQYSEVSIAEENGQPSLRYYPNPTRGKLTIATTGELPNHVSILDLSGRPVGQLELESNTIQLPELKAGMYILQWKWESGRVVTSRVVVQ